jgi:hypothetical protein
MRVPHHWTRGRLLGVFEEASRITDGTLAKPMNGINAPKRPDCVADDAVHYEPVSAPNSLLTGKLTGNFAESGHPSRFSRLISARIQ